MKPYYEQDGIIIYHADCREIIPSIEFDLMVSDPPYGVDFEYRSYRDSEENWSLTKENLTAVSQSVPSAVCMSFRRQFEMPTPLWQLCWHKPGSVRRSRISGWSTWEPILLYGRGWKFSQDVICLPDCINHTPEADAHPCPKPLSLFSWIIGGSPQGVILDPYAGSGTTLRAAKDHRRKAIGIEIDERYCEIAARRLAQGVLFGATV